MDSETKKERCTRLVKEKYPSAATQISYEALASFEGTKRSDERSGFVVDNYFIDAVTEEIFPLVELAFVLNIEHYCGD